MGKVTAVAHGSSATAKDWIWSPPVSGSVEPQTYTFEQGDTTTRAHRLAYGLFTDWGYKGDRKKGLDTSGKLIAQPLIDAITMTSSPSAVALAPLAGKHVNIYLDSTSGGLGTTQLMKVLDIDYSFGGIYGAFYPFNRATLGWTAHVDMAPKTTIKLLMEADATGMSQLTNLQNSTTQFLRISGQGLQIASDGPGAVYNTFQHDMAVEVTKTTPLLNKGGVFSEPLELEVVRDCNCGEVPMGTVSNLFTAFLGLKHST